MARPIIIVIIVTTDNKEEHKRYYGEHSVCENRSALWARNEGTEQGKSQRSCFKKLPQLGLTSIVEHCRVSKSKEAELTQLVDHHLQRIKPQTKLEFKLETLLLYNKRKGWKCKIYWCF